MCRRSVFASIVTQIFHSILHVFLFCCTLISSRTSGCVWLYGDSGMLISVMMELMMRGSV